MRLLATREHSRLELERKLRRHETEPGNWRACLTHCRPRASSTTSGWSSRCCIGAPANSASARIRQELQDKGLPVEAIRDAVAGLQGSELARARAVWRKKFAATKPSQAPGEARAPDAADRARQIRYLAARGFAGDTIRRVVSGAGDWLDESSDE